MTDAINDLEKLEAMTDTPLTVRRAAQALIDDVRRRYPGEALRCPHMIALDNALATPTVADNSGEIWPTELSWRASAPEPVAPPAGEIMSTELHTKPDNDHSPATGDVGKVIERLDRLAKRRDMEGIYTDGNICEEAAAMLRSLAEDRDNWRMLERLDRAEIASLRAANKILSERDEIFRAKLERARFVLEDIAGNTHDPIASKACCDILEEIKHA